MSREVEEIKQRLDIVDVIQAYVPLKRAGANWKGVCPFHQEKSPSFMVSQTKQIYHCFGCHEGGDVLAFVQKMEGLDFYETLKILGERVGVKVEKQNRPEHEVKKKDRLREILSLTEVFYNKLLTSHPQTEEARAYTKQRGLQPATIAEFKIGYAPDRWDVLMKYLQTQGYTSAEMAEAGVLVYNQDRKSYYDRFRGRLMIPLRDVNGRVVGFTARAIAKDFEGGKYINTPQTELYDKSRVVFALDAAKQAMKQAGYAVVVEGNMDAISSHQAGVRPVVAVSGTAFTEAQIGLIKRFTNTLIFSFDADAAGMMASRRGMELALRAGMQVKALTLPYGKDPDECIQKDVELWKQAIAGAKPVMDIVFERALNQHDRRNPEGKKAIVTDVLSFLRFFPNPVEIEHYVRLLSDELQTSMDVLYGVLRQQAPVVNTKPASPGVSVAPAAKPSIPSQESVAAQEVLALLSVYPDLLDQPIEETLFTVAVDQALYKTMKSYYDSAIITGENPLSTQAFIQGLTDDLQTHFTRLQLFGDKEFAELTGPEATQVLGARLSYLKRHQLQRQLADLQLHIKEAEKKQDLAGLEQLSKDFSVLSQQLSELS